MKVTALALLAFLAVGPNASHKSASSSLKRETLASAISSWDGTPYKSYPTGQPQITVLKITIAAHTTMKWHSHPMPNAGYVLSGDITVEKEDGTKKHFVGGQAFNETVGSVHRGVAGDEPAVLIVFYAGQPGLALSQ